MQYKNTLEQYLDGSLFKCETNTATPYIDGAIFSLAVIQLGKKYAEAGFPFYDNLTLEEYGENIFFVVSYSGIVRLSRGHIFVLWEFSDAVFSYKTNILTDEFCDTLIRVYGIMLLIEASEKLYNSEGWMQNHTTNVK